MCLLFDMLLSSLLTRGMIHVALFIFFRKQLQSRAKKKACPLPAFCRRGARKKESTQEGVNVHEHHGRCSSKTSGVHHHCSIAIYDRGSLTIWAELYRKKEGRFPCRVQDCYRLGRRLLLLPSTQTTETTLGRFTL